MAQTNINIRIDENIKKQAEDLFAEMGLNMTTAFNIFVRQTLREGSIPFVITTEPDPFYNPANMKRLRHSIQQANEGKVVAKSMDELEKMANE
jgi:DNA-damage-inducible protein J